ncbi:IS200/IS605 family element transposase accessory protein TnpB [Azospirillum brasilense]|nr:IS200/IS605 family element transposase accessory protein TnpB [Azospirillum brasilense]
MPVLSYKHRLYPNRAQVAGFEAMLGAFCDLYNAALQQRIEAYRRLGKTLRYVDQASELKAVRAVDERLAGYSFSAEQQVLRRLDKAFRAFFRRLKTKGKAGFPRFRAKSVFDSAEFRVGDGLTIRRSGRLGIVGIPGELKVKWHRNLPAGAKIGTAVLSRSAGKWFLCFQITMSDEEVQPRDGASVGIDVGLSSLIATSNGETVAAPQWTKLAAKKQRRLQRALARAKRGSKRRLKAKCRLARHSAATANQRRDFLHKLARSLVGRYAFIAIEDLSVDRLARSMFAKAVHNAAWGQFRSFLEYKAANAGVRVEAVDPRGTSQTCPECGAVVAKTLADRTHRCVCGCVMDRDVAAAKVILHRAIHGKGPGHGLRTPSQRVAA